MSHSDRVAPRREVPAQQLFHVLYVRLELRQKLRSFCLGEVRHVPFTTPVYTIETQCLPELYDSIEAPCS